jgi:exopolyphosphatase/guanosine-5'-triphosphate,3'-diphosphate pyrophosphatase
VKRIGIIDIGSNSIRLNLVEFDRNYSFSIIDEVKESVRLGKDMSADGELNPLRMDNAMNTLAFFKRLCISQNTTEIIAVATEAVRKAANQQEFLNKAKSELNVDIRVLSGTEEAFYDYFGTINTLDLEDGLLIDIGGSSTELAYMKKRKLIDSISLPFGAIDLSEKFSLFQTMDEKKEKDMKDYITSYFKNIPWLNNLQNINIIGVGGSIRNIAKIHQKQSSYPMYNLHNYRMNSRNVSSIYGIVKNTDLEQRKKIKGLSKDRADIILGPLAALTTLQEFVNSKELSISSHGVRSGLLYEYLLQSTTPLCDVFNFSISKHLDKYAENETHPKKVWSLMESMYNQLNPLLRLNINPYKMIKAASLLHDCGININYYDHHKHSFYMILNSNINGLTHKEHLMAAYIAANHRRNNFKISSEYSEKILSSEDIATIDKLSILLRISESLDTAMNSNVTVIQCSIERDKVVITLQAKSDTVLEVHDAIEAAPAFKKIFNRNLVIQ